MARSKTTDEADAAIPVPTNAATAAGPGSPARAEPRDALAAGHTAAQGQAELTDRGAFEINCLRNTHYHEERERFFARWHKGTMFVAVLGGSAAFAPLDRGYWIAGLLVAVAGLIDLVFDVSGRARLHASLRRRIYEILAEAQDEGADLAGLKKRAIAVYADEPPCMYAVNALAYNSAMEAFERPSEFQLKISFSQRFWRNVWPFPQTAFKTFADLGETPIRPSRHSPIA